jgi:hypothetical protein
VAPLFYRRQPTWYYDRNQDKNDAAKTGQSGVHITKWNADYAPSCSNDYILLLNDNFIW